MPPSSGTNAHNLDYFKRHANGPLPFCIQISSPNPGDHVVIVGATHGNEPSGVRAMVNLHQALDSGKLNIQKGIISLLVGNPRAYERDVRYIDYDLNRAFDGQKRSAAEGKRAREIKRFFENHDDIKAVLDLHSVSIGDFKILVYPRQTLELTALAARLSPIPLHFVYHTEHMPGTLIAAAGRKSICGVMVECGDHHSAHGVETAAEHIHRILAYHRLLEFKPRPPIKPAPAITRYESIQAITPHANFRFLIKDIQTGTHLKKGQRFATDDSGEHLAPQDCYVVAPSKVVKPTDVDAGFLATLTARKNI